MTERFAKVPPFTRDGLQFAYVNGPRSYIIMRADIPVRFAAEFADWVCKVCNQPESQGEKDGR